MTREQVEERIVDPAGPPPPGSAERRAFDDWLEREPELRERFERQRAVFAAMELWESPEPSQGFDRELRRRLEEPESFWSRLGGRRFWLAPAAAAAVALAIWTISGDDPAR